MHDLGLVQEIVALAQSEIQRADRAGHAGRVTRLTLRVGKLSGASPEAMRTAFAVVAPMVGWPDAELVIEEPGAVCRCYDCGARSEITEYVYACPVCGEHGIGIEGGDELQLASIDLDD